MTINLSSISWPNPSRQISAGSMSQYVTLNGGRAVGVAFGVGSVPRLQAESQTIIAKTSKIIPFSDAKYFIFSLIFGTFSRTA
jgi:hypothetical protein